MQMHSWVCPRIEAKNGTVTGDHGGYWTEELPRDNLCPKCHNPITITQTVRVVQLETLA